jgi:hypothetical protein
MGHSYGFCCNHWPKMVLFFLVQKKLGALVAPGFSACNGPGRLWLPFPTLWPAGATQNPRRSAPALAPRTGDNLLVSCPRRRAKWVPFFSDSKWKPAAAHASNHPERERRAERARTCRCRGGASCPGSCPISSRTTQPSKLTNDPAGEGACHQMPGVPPGPSRCPVPLVPAPELD